jgi:general nucleoside transport system permease protein
MKWDYIWQDQKGRVKMLINNLKKVFKNIRPTLISIGAGLIVGFIIMLIVSPTQAISALGIMFIGGLRNGIKGLGDTLYFGGPYILVGLSVAFAFKTGLFNIGASGQIMLGALFALFVALKVDIPAPFHYPAAVLAGIIGGALLGSITGFLKAFFNVNEVVTTIMLNYMTIYFTIFSLLQFKMVDSLSGYSMIPPVSARAPNFGFNVLFNGSPLDISIFLALGATILIYILLNKTVLGFELKAVGFNPSASNYAGINYKKNIIISMAIAGALSGLAGAALYLNATSGKRLLTSVDLLPEGFDGITIALLASSNPIGVFFAGLFISHIRLGGFYLQLLDGISFEIISIIIATIIYFSAISNVLQTNLTKITSFIKSKLKPAAKKRGGKV